MKIYKKFMDILATIEKIVLALATLLIVVITVGNVLSRYLIHRSWSFTEELVVAVFVLITLLAAALACRDGELVSLSIFTDMLPQKSRKFMVILMTVLSVIFTTSCISASHCMISLPLYYSNMVWRKLLLSSKMVSVHLYLTGLNGYSGLFSLSVLDVWYYILLSTALIIVPTPLKRIRR